MINKFIGARAKVHNRNELTLGEIYKIYYAEAGFKMDYVSEVWLEISSILKIPFGMIRPEDKLAGDLTNEAVITPKLDNLSDAAIERSRLLRKKIDLDRIVTVDDYVKAFAD